MSGYQDILEHFIVDDHGPLRIRPILRHPFSLQNHPEDNPWANRFPIWSTPSQTLPPGGSICGRLTQDLPLGCLQGGLLQCDSSSSTITAPSESVRSCATHSLFKSCQPPVHSTFCKWRGLTRSARTRRAACNTCTGLRTIWKSYARGGALLLRGQAAGRQVTSLT